MAKQMFFALTLTVVLFVGVVSARQLRTPVRTLGVCHGTCSPTVTCFGTCFCIKGFCVSEPPGQARSGKQ
jgi:hypothetical protein